MEQALVPLLRMDLLTLSSDSVTCLLRKVPEPTICKLSRPSFLGLLFHTLGGMAHAYPTMISYRGVFYFLW